MGDPLLRIKRPEKITLSIPKEAVSGESMAVKGNAPVEGNLTVELAYQRDRLRNRRPSRREYVATEEEFKSYQATYEQSQDLVWVKQTIAVKAGEFETNLDVPDELVGRCLVRAMLVSENSFGLGSAGIEIKKDPVVRNAKRAEAKLK